ncbi:unnamed protein product [Miscanthus lutarioriparius]|uniref:Non-haem dioxygenase N-terminal domain-containing protein n=1 Tax=Miscanthus lutarioriparius TaxID=422564 RepID=A0A811MAI5_9POAL|nr:unnamed protein product [Miscanthus lutarioriparius]
MAEARSTGSLLVPNVQALAETCNGTDGQVPGRYLIVDAGSETEKVVADRASAIPIIDLRRLLDPRSSPEECAKLGSACHDWGFFQLINHGLPDEVIGNLMRDVAEFLKLPLEAKKEWSKQHDSVEGYGQAFAVSERVYVVRL